MEMVIFDCKRIERIVLDSDTYALVFDSPDFYEFVLRRKDLFEYIPYSFIKYQKEIIPKMTFDYDEYETPNDFTLRCDNSFLYDISFYHSDIHKPVENFPPFLNCRIQICFEEDQLSFVLIQTPDATSGPVEIK